MPRTGQSRPAAPRRFFACHPSVSASAQNVVDSGVTSACRNRLISFTGRAAGTSMLRKDAEREIIREWMALPEGERQSERQAAEFALRMKRKYAFDYLGGDRYQEIRRMMLRHEKRTTDPT
jgi:hypothetical protein